MCSQSLSCFQLFVTLCTVAHQGPLPIGILQARILEQVAIFYFRGSSHPRIEPASPASSALAGGFFTTLLPGKPFDHRTPLITVNLKIKS